MTTITEDYVSFEIAKLLKEKGFDEICFTWYTGKGKFKQGKNTYDDYHMNHFQDMDVAKCSAPTLQMAMKWLREVHNLFVDIYYDYDFREGYKFSIHKLTKGTTLETNNENYSTYEQACDKAIKYCLENLM